MTLFQDQGFQKVKGFIPSFFSTYLRNYFTLRAQNDGLGGDEQAPNSHCMYGDPAFDMDGNVHRGYRKHSWKEINTSIYLCKNL